jgi:hypothetical protein
MNYSIPEFKALCRRSWFTKNDEDYNTFDDVYVFGIQSVTDRWVSEDNDCFYYDLNKEN